MINHKNYLSRLLLAFSAFLFLCVPFSSAIAETEIIIDNGQSGTSFTGTWAVSSGTNFYGADSVWARNGATYTWQFNSLPPGLYEISMWWSGYQSRASNIPVDIFHRDGKATVSIDQSKNAGIWNSLGQYSFTSTGKVTITAATGSTLSTCADAVRFKLLVPENILPVAVIDSISPNPALPGQTIAFAGHGTDTDSSIAAYQWTSNIDGPLSSSATFTSAALSEGSHTISLKVQDDKAAWSATVTKTLIITSPSSEVIIDNGQSGTSFTGTWAVSSGTNFYGADSVWARNGATYTWQFNSLPPGLYEISMWWSGYQSRASNIPVDIFHRDGKATVSIDQSKNAGIWNSLGQYSFTSTGKVTITAATGSTLSTCADAVRFKLLVPENILPVAVIDSISPNPALPGQTIAFAGHGTDTDSSIAAYQWTSNIDGPLSSSATFTSSALSEGSHTISLKVQDDKAAWSATVTRLLVVGIPPNSLPVAVIDSISPNPALPGQTIAFAGHGTDTDSSIAAYQWTSNIDGPLSSSATFTSAALSEGSHTISLKVQDDKAAWSAGAIKTLTVSSGQQSSDEHIYVALLHFSKLDQTALTSTLGSIGAVWAGSNLWKYYNYAQQKTYIIHLVTDIESLRKALYTENSHIIIRGHSNYGIGGVFMPNYLYERQTLGKILYMDDDLIFNYSSPWIGVKIYRMTDPEKWRNWWPVFKDGTSAIMPYDFNDLRGDPPYNYYITYQVPGDSTFYKIETVANSAMERFPDSDMLAWFSPDGSSPDSSNPDHLQYFITNPDPLSTIDELCGNAVCPRTHYKKKTVLFRKEAEVDIQNMKYKRMLYDACLVGNYYLDTFHRGIMFYTVENSSGEGTWTYLRLYLQGKSDEEIWESMQDVEPVYDYYNFNKRPSDQ